ncbi:MAG: hypothetical protein PVI90_07450 [Desulfobacteraceae bacterium]|jgi:hypothetical protein
MIILKHLNYIILFSLLLLNLTLQACKGSNENVTQEEETIYGLNNATNIAGTVYSANGDPMAGVTIYIPKADVSIQAVQPTRTYTQSLTASDGTTCEDPPSPDNSLTATCTGADGTFDMDTLNVTDNPDQIIFQKGSLRLVQDLSCTSDPCKLTPSTTTFTKSASWPEIAVVSGQYSRIENLLAKLADNDVNNSFNGAYGRIDEQTGVFVYGSEFGSNLTLIDGTGSLYPSENTNMLSYDSWESYFDGTNLLVINGSPVFDIIFINSGNEFEFDILEDPEQVALLQKYVNAGGRLYVTDISYDFIEQLFPQVMRFEGELNDPKTPGTLDMAQIGMNYISFNGAVRDDGLASWLQNVSVNRHDDQTPGNPDEDCYNLVDEYEQITGALTSDDLIPLGNFLSNWAEMIGNHPGENSKIWISAGDDVVIDRLINRPLTISRTIGSNGGMVIYSSFNPADACPTNTFWPQERVLQYLIYEAF